jgi:drug/metabolite transporter (DMT)-like permease
VHVILIAALLQASPEPPVRRYAGIAVAMLGVAAITGGVVSSSYSSRRFQLATDATDVETSFARYNESVSANQIGWGLGLTGLATLVLGLIITLVPEGIFSLSN